MPRTAIVIGVGGTGAWILSHLKKELLETYGSLETQPIRLLLVDTASNIAEVGRAGANQGTNPQVANAGDYSRFKVLDEVREYLHIPTNENDQYTRHLKKLVLDNDAGVSHLSEWWEAGFYPDSILRLTDGAAQFRQLGRLALVQGLHQNGRHDAIIGTLTNLIDQVLRVAGELPPKLDVHITGSLVGGTGSGVFIDIAWLVRKVMELRGDAVNPAILGFFVMPGALSPNPTRGQRMKAFAAWRELNRMMTIRENENEMQVRWGQQAETMYTARKPVYDHVYLVNRPAGGIGAGPEYTVFPVMAEAIGFYLDGQAGERYIQHIVTNLANHRSSAPLRGNPTYSVLSVKSWGLRSYHNLRVAQHDFARQYLERLLQVITREEQDPQDPRIKRPVYSIRSDPMFRQRAQEMFSAPLNQSGSTQFIADIANLRNIRNDEFTSQAQQYAQSFTNILSQYAQMPQTPEGIAIANQIDETVSYAVPAFIDSNKNEELESQIQSVSDELYGVNRRGDVYLRLYGDFGGQQYKGTLYQQLEHVHSFHLSIFRQRVQEWMQTTLNEPVAQGFSGIACVRDAVDQALEDLKLARRFYAEVQNQMPSVTETQTNADTQYSIAATSAARRGLTETPKNIAGGGAKRDVRMWFEWEYANNAAKRDHRAIERILNTLLEMQTFIEEVVQPKLEALIQQLVTSDSYSGIRGLYPGLMDSAKEEDERHQFDLRLSAVVTPLEAPVTVTIDDAMIDQLLGRTRWSVDERMNLRIEIQLSVDPNDPKITLESNLKDRESTQKLIARLVDSVAGAVIAVQGAPVTALNILGVAALANELPLVLNNYLHADHAAHPAVRDIRTFYVRARATQQEANQIDAALQMLPTVRNNASPVEHVQSDNLHKITVFSARELILPESFAEWWADLGDYQVTVTGDKAQNILPDYERVSADHIFAGERQALAFEYNAFRHDAANAIMPVLDQRLVHLLEKPRRFDQFLTLWALGWIQLERDNPGDPNRYWRIVLPNDYGMPNVSLAERNDGDMLTVMSRYILVGKAITGHYIPYPQIDKLIDQTINQIRADQALGSQLVASYRYESDAAAKLAVAIEQQLAFMDGQVNPGMFSSKFDQVTGTLERPALYQEVKRRALAEYIAEDFGRTRNIQNGLEPLVTNVQAHSQALSILLRLKYLSMSQALRNQIN